MLPGLRFVLAAIGATVLLVVLGFMELVKLQIAQGHSAGLAPIEARFAGLAFAERADWTPVPRTRRRSLESMAPFAGVPLLRVRLDDAAEVAMPARPRPLPPQRFERRREIAVKPPVLLALADVGVERSVDAPKVATDVAMPTIPARRLVPVVHPSADMAITFADEQTTASIPAITQSWPAPQSAAALPQEAALVASVAVDTIDTVPNAMPTALLSATRLPFPPPITAALSRDVFPLPVPRPIIALRVVPRARPHVAAKNVATKQAAKKKVAQTRPRKPARPAAPAESPALGNPFVALFRSLSGK